VEQLLVVGAKPTNQSKLNQEPGNKRIQNLNNLSFGDQIARPDRSGEFVSEHGYHVLSVPRAAIHNVQIETDAVTQACGWVITMRLGAWRGCLGFGA
jgi:hypothetical protein